MNIVKDPKRLALVVIDTARQRYTRYIGAQKDASVEGDWLTENEVEHFRINPRDFMGIHCQPEVA
jgi:hypothetical protein